MVTLMRYIALCAVLATLAPAASAQTPAAAGAEAAPSEPAPSEPKGTAPATGSKEIDPALREASGRQLTLRDPGFASNEPVVIIPPSAEQPDNRHKWLLGLGIVLLVIAFYMTTRSRDAAPEEPDNGHDEDQPDDQAGDPDDPRERGNREGEGEAEGNGGNNGNGHTQAPPHERGKGDG